MDTLPPVPAPPAGGPPKRFRRRLLVVMLAVGLLPVLIWGIVTEAVTARLLSVSLRPMETLLEDLDGALAQRAEDAPLAAAVRRARLDLAQVELARRSLARLTPRALTLILIVSALALALTAVLLGRSLSRPVEQLADGMARYARGELGYRLAPARARAPDELQYLIEAFNRMGDELAAQRARLEVSEALGAWQGVARSLAHELKNPLTAMRMAVGRLLRTGVEGLSLEDLARRGDALGLMESQIDALLRMAESFSAFARLPAPVLQPTQLRPLVAEMCDLYQPAAPGGIELAEGPEVSVSADAQQLRQALGNLLKNAVEASGPADGPVKVTLSLSSGQAQIEVSDNGPGIAKPLSGSDLARSFGTTKPQGSGLGLPIVAKIVHDHGGTVRIDPLPGRGTRATIALPVLTATATESEKPTPAPEEPADLPRTEDEIP
jgi:nitrogen fixation/metabolism regulation signal transduction histidine kinase